MAREATVELGMHNLTKVGLADKVSQYPSRLSGGQQQRVAIARAMTMQPQVMLFNEPTSALYPELVGQVLAVMQRLVEEGMTIVTVTHEMNFAHRFADRIIYMDEGRFVESAPPEEMFANPRDERTRQFLSHLHVS